MSAVLALGIPVRAVASELAGAIALTSEYIYRGQALSDGKPALQAGIDYAHDSGFFAGVWGSTVDLQGPATQRDLEVDYYLGYHYVPQAPVSVALSLVRYTWPGQEGRFDYDFTEGLLTLTYQERYSVEFGYSRDVYGWDAAGRHVELRGDRPLDSAWIISAGIGYNDIEDTGTSNYLYWDVGATARYSRLMLDLRWHDNETPRGTLSGLSAGSHIVATLSLAF